MKRPAKNTGSLPFVFSNFATTADGKIAFADHHFEHFPSQRDADHMMELRATADAVLSGARTVESGPVTMGTGGRKYSRLRLKRGLAEHNLRIIATRSGDLDPDAEIFKHTFSPIIILTTKPGATRLKKLKVPAEIKICGDREINFRTAFRWLRKEWGVKRLLCEGGGDLHGVLVRAGLVDELHLTLCPLVFGGRTAPTLADATGAATLAGAKPFRLQSARRIGGEFFTVWKRVDR